MTTMEKFWVTNLLKCHRSMTAKVGLRGRMAGILVEKDHDAVGYQHMHKLAEYIKRKKLRIYKP